MTVKKHLCSRRWTLLPTLHLVGIPAGVAWWWIDSAVTCEQQDEYTVDTLLPRLARVSSPFLSRRALQQLRQQGIGID